MKAVAASRLTQRFGPVTALHPLDLELEEGERLAVLGGNGAGKTTLLRILATVARPAAGELRLFGLDALRERAQARRRVGYLGHGLGLYQVLTGLENLAFYAALAGLPRGSAEAAWEAAELPRSAARRPLQELSRGMQQRLALTRSLLHDPALWIVDEPDASLDEAGALLLGRLMGTRTVVMATHDRELGAALCGKGLLLEAGRASPLARPPGRELVPEPIEALG